MLSMMNQHSKKAQPVGYTAIQVSLKKGSFSCCFDNDFGRNDVTPSFGVGSVFGIDEVPSLFLTAFRSMFRYA
ncbi:hypothetical protein [Actinopolyspora mortivallis]|uniref:hypothetical protein n=1 Tax=Actinopolyspora mortivallis TaxID=33906 RepID=UPI0011B2456E|nr:hypothetical protein [Actinopolyspora mortivallis]